MNAFIHRIAAILLGLMIAIPAAFGDDIEIYNNPEDNPLRPPMTILVLDLNLLALCNIALTGAENEANPAAPQVCLDLNNVAPLQDILAGVLPDDQTPAGFLTGKLSSMSASALCSLTNSLGLSSPSIPLGGLLGNLTCGTLSGLLGNPLIGGIVNAALPGFVDQLVAGLVNPLLTTVVGQLPSAVRGVLNTTIAGILNLGQTNLISLLEASSTISSTPVWPLSCRTRIAVPPMDRQPVNVALATKRQSRLRAGKLLVAATAPTFCWALRPWSIRVRSMPYSPWSHPSSRTC